jgi:transcription elongation factor Elf1
MQECTFCTNTAVVGFTINYAMTGLVHHCRDCAVEFGLLETGYTQSVDN